MKTKTKKGNVAVIAIIMVIVAITAGVLGYLLAKKSAAPIAQTQEVSVSQSAVKVKSKDQSGAPSDWKTYSSTVFDASISLPNDWKEVMVHDGSLTEIGNGIFNGELKYGFLVNVTSPDEKENISFTGEPLLDTEGCSIELLEINKHRVKYIVCQIKENANRYSYEFIDKKLVVTTYDDNKSTLFDKVVSLIKFNAPDETANWQTYENDKYGFEFKYPVDAVVKENPYVRIFVLQKNETESDNPYVFDLDIEYKNGTLQDFKTGWEKGADGYFENEVLAGNEAWKISSASQDAEDEVFKKLTYHYFIKGDMSYFFAIKNDSIGESILSTFKFTK